MKHEKGYLLRADIGLGFFFNTGRQKNRWLAVINLPGE